MIPETVSTTEIIRLFVAAFGLRVSWSGRRTAQANLAAVPADPTDDIHELREREQRANRMRLFMALQTGFVLVHALLLVNVLVNMAYPSAPIEQPNIMTSNLAQILIPLILSRLSELMTMKLDHAVSLHVVTGERSREG